MPDRTGLSESACELRPTSHSGTKHSLSAAKACPEPVEGRRKNAAYSASCGQREGNEQAPEGRKKSFACRLSQACPNTKRRMADAIESARILARRIGRVRPFESWQRLILLPHAEK